MQAFMFVLVFLGLNQPRDWLVRPSLKWPVFVSGNWT